jgi:hypothetical protein
MTRSGARIPRPSLTTINLSMCRPCALTPWIRTVRDGIGRCAEKGHERRGSPGETGQGRVSHWFSWKASIWARFPSPAPRVTAARNGRNAPRPAQNKPFCRRARVDRRGQEAAPSGPAGTIRGNSGAMGRGRSSRPPRSVGAWLRTMVTTVDDRQLAGARRRGEGRGGARTRVRRADRRRDGRGTLHPSAGGVHLGDPPGRWLPRARAHVRARSRTERGW